MEKDLLLSAKNGNSFAFAELIEIYSPLIDSMSEKYRGISERRSSEKDDFHQEACIAFYRALLTYDTEQDKVTFGLYAKICIRNRLVSMLRKNRSEKKRIPKSDASVESAAQSYQAKTDRSELKTLIDSVLTDYEKRVITMYLDGSSYSDIARKLGKTVKSVDNALFRAKKKLKSGFGM